MILTNAIITGFCLCIQCCGPASAAHPGLTASGVIAKPGITIAAPRAIPLGSTVIINGHIYTVQDRTARRFNGRFDIFFSSHKEALAFGKQTNNIIIK